MWGFLSFILMITLYATGGAGGAHWSYQQRGHSGPDHWEGVCKEGRAQSPINIATSEHVSLPAWEFGGYDQDLSSIQITNNGHSIKFSSDGFQPSVTGGGLPGTFVFAQAHFHWGNSSHVGSEHLIGGEAFPLELHLVHYNSKYGTLGEAVNHPDGLAVIGIMHELAGIDNPHLDPIFETLEKIKVAKSAVTAKEKFSLSSFLPLDASAFYRYSGSLTTPGCNEIVTWTVLHHPQFVSEQQLERLRSVLDSDGYTMGNNYRPVMPLHGRAVTVSGLQPEVVITHKVAPHWNYQQGGHGGPDHWPGECEAGKAQSPINIQDPEQVTLPAWRFTGYQKPLLNIQVTNNGHSIKFSSQDITMPSVTGGGLPGKFVFAQAHFHWGNTSHVGSEHLIGGEAFPLELHLVHFNSKYGTIGEALKYPDGLAVIGIMHEVSGKDNPNLDPIIDSLDNIKDAKSQTNASTCFSLSSFLPSEPSAFYRYSGSLTTPGCNEIVTWSVLHHPQQVSEQQLERLRSVLDSDGHTMGNNYRPVMPTHGRTVMAVGLHHKVVITKHQGYVGDKPEQNTLWYFNQVPGWAVVLIALAVGLNVGCVVYLMTRNKQPSHVRVPTEEF